MAAPRDWQEGERAMIEALMARVYGDEALVSRFRSSHHFAAILFFGIESTPASPCFLLWLLVQKSA
jgi:hypothetical protein